MREKALSLISELEQQLQTTSLSGDNVSKMNEIVGSLKALVEGNNIFAEGGDDVAVPYFPETGVFEVEKSDGNTKGNIEFKNSQWYLAGTELLVKDKDAELRYLHIKVSNDLVYFYKNVAPAGYRFYGYKFAQSDTQYPEDTFQWYDREREVMVEGSLILYRNEQLKG